MTGGAVTAGAAAAVRTDGTAVCDCEAWDCPAGAGAGSGPGSVSVSAERRGGSSESGSTYPCGSAVTRTPR